MKKLYDMKEKLVERTKSQIEENWDCVSHEELGEAVDMIKDLSEAIYYCTVTEAMQTQSMHISSYGYGPEMYGYNPNRSASTGRYTSGRSGFNRPWPDQQAYINEYLDDPYAFREHMNDPYGYASPSMNRSQTGTSTHMTSGGRYGYSGMYPEEGANRYGRAYNDYKMAQRHYTESHSEKDKAEMKTHANQHLSDTMASLRDIWDEADPEMKKRMKNDLMGLVEDMTI